MVYQVDGPLLLAGLGISTFLGYVSLKALTKIYHKKDGLTMFAPYCWLLSLSILMTIVIL